MPNDPLMTVCEWGCMDGKCIDKPPCTDEGYKTNKPDEYNRFLEYAADLTERSATEAAEARILFADLQAAVTSNANFEGLTSILAFTAEDLQYIQTEYHIQAISDGKECYLDRSEKTSSTLVGKFAGTWAEALVYIEQSFTEATTGDGADAGYWIRKKDWTTGVVVVPSKLNEELGGVAEELILKDEAMLRTSVMAVFPILSRGLSEQQQTLIVNELQSLWSSLGKDYSVVEQACRENCMDSLISCDWIESEESGLSLDDAATLRFWLCQQGWRGVRDKTENERAWIEYRRTHPEVVAKANAQLLVLRFWTFYVARELGYEGSDAWSAELTPIINNNKALVLRDWYLAELKKQGKTPAPTPMVKTDYTVVSLEEDYAVIKKGDSGKPQMITVGVKIEDKFTVKAIDRSTGVTLTLADGTEVILPPPKAEADDAETAPQEVPVPPPTAPAGRVIILR